MAGSSKIKPGHDDLARHVSHAASSPTSTYSARQYNHLLVVASVGRGRFADNLGFAPMRTQRVVLFKSRSNLATESGI
jgi:hypothetical protein